MIPERARRLRKGRVQYPAPGPDTTWMIRRRKELGLTQRELAILSGVPLETISALERGKHTNMRRVTREAITEAVVAESRRQRALREKGA